MKAECPFQHYCKDHNFGWSIDEDGRDSGCVHCVAECTHSGLDLSNCHCPCETCGQEDCVCCVCGRTDEHEHDEGDDYWRRVDAEMDLIRDGF